MRPVLAPYQSGFFKSPKSQCNDYNQLDWNQILKVTNVWTNLWHKNISVSNSDLKISTLPIQKTERVTEGWIKAVTYPWPAVRWRPRSSCLSWRPWSCSFHCGTFWDGLFSGLHYAQSACGITTKTLKTTTKTNKQTNKNKNKNKKTKKSVEDMYFLHSRCVSKWYTTYVGDRFSVTITFWGFQLLINLRWPEWCTRPESNAVNYCTKNSDVTCPFHVFIVRTLFYFSDLCYLQ